MSTSAIHIAFQLAKHPDKMEWLSLPETPLPKGTADLIRLCASSKRIEQLANKINLKPMTIRIVLVNFIEKVLINDKNDPNKLLGLQDTYETAELKLHYQLLMRIFHPDLSISKQASDKSALITKSYQILKIELDEPPQFKNIKLSRVPPKSFYQATHSAELHRSGLKNTSMVFGALGLVSFGFILTYLFQFTKPELVAKSPQLSIISKEDSIYSNNQTDNRFRLAKANFSGASKFEITQAILQMMLRDIEKYYENGIVNRIKPILANTPEMRNQSDEDMQVKLETLFNITQKRKMLLYDFEWENVSGKIRGEGKFISRYQMTGQMSWQTRKGIAVVTAEETNDNFSVTGLKLDNNMID